MEQKEIEEGNKIIAEFLYDSKDWKYLGQQYSIFPNLLYYHTNFSSLMEVVEKIESIPIKDGSTYEVHIGRCACDITQELDAEHFLGTIISTFYPTKIEAVWQACVRFIKFWNKENI